MLKKIYTLFFLILVLTQIVGFNIFFNIEKLSIKQNLKSYLKKGVPENLMVKFEFSNEDFNKLNWIKPTKEFKIADKYYDVVWKKKLNKNKLLVLCVDDIQETRLFIHLAKFTTKNLSKENHHSMGFVFELVKSPYVTNNLRAIFLKGVENSELDNVFRYIKNLSDGHFNITTPPPSIG
jgi:hypothetical protein